MSLVEQSRAWDHAGQATKRSKWHYLYFVLAALHLFTVGIAVYSTHEIMGNFAESVEANRVWAERANAYSYLGELAGAVNRPANDLFHTLDVEAETDRIHEAVKAFDLEFERLRAELPEALPPEQATPLMERLAAVDNAMDAMRVEAKQIFAHFRAGRPGAAADHMAMMDRRFAEVNSALFELRRLAAKAQLEHFDAQRSAAARWQRYEFALVVLILLLVAGTAYYGYRLARQVQRDFREEQRRLVELGKAQQALQEANRRLQGVLGRALESHEAQRQQIARELHEEVAQMLGSLRMRLDALREAPRIPQQAEPHVEAAGSIAASAIHRLQDLVRDLTPQGLEDVGLAGVLAVKLQEWTKGQRLAVHFTEHLGDARLPLRIATAAYRVAEEAVANAVLHADARTLHVELSRAPGELRLRVADDGVGFDPVSVRRASASSEAMGISVMEQRTALLGGSLVVVSQPAGGTTVTAVFPIRADEE